MSCHTTLDSLFRRLFWPNTNWFLERQVAGTQIVISSFIVSDPSRLIRSQQDKNSQSDCNVAVIWCSNPRNIKRQGGEVAAVTGGRCPAMRSFITVQAKHLKMDCLKADLCCTTMWRFDKTKLLERDLKHRTHSAVVFNKCSTSAEKMSSCWKNPHLWGKNT